MKDARKYVIGAVALAIVMIIAVFGINLYVTKFSKEYIVYDTDYLNLEGCDCILVLGAGIWQDKPSPMLKDRLVTAIDLYKKGVSKKIIMSGDHSREDYDEVNIMKNFAIENGVPSEDIFMDHAGFSSYESMYRAKEVFDVKRMVIVTQKYHLFRSLYIANKLGIKAYGVEAESIRYAGDIYRELREVLARNKDFVKCILKPKPTYLGELIPISGNGNITNDNTKVTR